MSTYKTEWPTLLKDGGWREVIKGPEYFKPLFRFRKGIAQIIKLDTEIREWRLTMNIGNRVIFTDTGDLTYCLLMADLHEITKPDRITPV